MTFARLTVVQVLPALESGGVERGTLEVARYLVEQGHRSIVISAGGRMVPLLEQQGSEHLCWPIGKKSVRTLVLVQRLRHYLIEQQVDILHVRSRFPGWIAYLAWSGMDPAQRPHLVTTVHGPYSVNAYSAVMTKGERVIVISSMIRDYVLQHYPVQPERLRLNYRGVDPDMHRYGYQPDAVWREAWYEAFPQTRQQRLITLPARVTRWKGQLDFIELIARLQPEVPEIHGLIVGEAKQDKSRFMQELRARAKELGVADRITFTGHRADVREIMAISDCVFSLSTEPEAFGRTTLEALSLGVPVMGYAHGGVGEQLAAILPEGLLPVGNIATAHALLLEWLKQPPTVPQQHPYSLLKMLENTLAIYLELAGTSVAGSASRPGPVVRRGSAQKVSPSASA
ncbi:glycosyltransferase [Pseudomethylobacillus aquaticus]|uniref:Glycosyltransferase n=1 Tax=Pseudomethylobacillus aquaticus TaxID=2676064 RepID=A0A3N0UY80_9PROT|nr:glycosyltransferase family 4 protein [Pseudomethylobacillus aquaticus]ROH85480.1 glycosyltransferase [Pseudomethylobacillus aquaticus]